MKAFTNFSVLLTTLKPASEFSPSQILALHDIIAQVTLLNLLTGGLKQQFSYFIILDLKTNKNNIYHKNITFLSNPRPFLHVS